MSFCVRWAHGPNRWRRVLLVYLEAKTSLLSQSFRDLEGGWLCTNRLISTLPVAPFFCFFFLFVLAGEFCFLTIGKVLAFNARTFAHTPEDAALLPQREGCVKLHDLASVHDANPVVANDGFQPMSYTEERFALKAARDSPLDPTVGLEVDGRSCFIAHDNLRASNERPCKRHQLALAERKIRAFLFDWCIEVDAVAFGILYVLILANQISLTEGGPKLGISILVERIQVAADGTL